MATSSHSKFPSRFGRYILLDRINSGGMAEVFRAKVTGVEGFQRIIAIKCMLPALHQDEQFVTMFKDEAKLSSQLSHANIVQIHELGAFDEQLYIAMELINGRDLRHVVKLAKHKNTVTPQGFAAYVVSRAAEGLDYAHHKAGMQGEPLNLVHRDVSPQNILVSYEGDVKVVDFGIAKAEERATETRAGVLKGKFAYMAPEQVMGQPLDARADLFALGCVLYEVLTGKKLFAGNSDLSILDKVRNATVPDFRVEIPNAPEALYNALTKVLSKDPNDRYARGHDFAEALEPLLITDGRIFNDRRAREFMQALYIEEIEELNVRNQRYATITLDDEPEPEDKRNKTQIFESAFGGTQPLGEAKGAAAKPRMPTGDGDLSGSNKPRMPSGGGDLSGSNKPRMPTGDGAMSGSRPRMPTGDGELKPGAKKSDDGWGDDEPSKKSSRGPRNTQVDPVGGAELTGQAEGFFGAGPGESTQAFNTSEHDAAPEHPSQGKAMKPLPPTTLGANGVAAAAAAAAEPAALTIPKPVVYASVFLAVSMLILVVVVALMPIQQSPPPNAAGTVVLQDLGGGTAQNPGAQNPGSGGTQPAPEPTNGGAAENPELPSDSIVTDGGEGEAAQGDDADAVTGQADDNKRRKGKKGATARKQFGYVSFLIIGAPNNKIMINGKDIGKNRFGVKLQVGNHDVKVVEEGGQGRSKTLTLKLGTSHTKSAPQKLKVAF